ncbi:phosphotransferase [Kribbella sp. WER1]
MTVDVEERLIGVRRFVAERTERWRQPLFRSGHLLVASSVLTGVVGIAYWLAAARLYPPDVVGRNSAAISAMMFLAGCAQLNLMSALLRFLPTSGSGAKAMVVRSYAVGGGLSLIAGAVFVLGVPLWTPELAGLVRAWPDAVLFTVATGCAAIFVMQDNVLVALGRPAGVPVENLVFAVLKLGLVVALATVAARNGIWISWVVGLLVAVVGTSVYLATRAVPRFSGPRSESVTLPELVRFVGPDYLGSLCWIASTTLVPVLVLGLAGSAEAAAFALPWSICLAAFQVPAAFGQSLVAAGARDPDRLPPHYRQLRRHTLTVLAPAVLVVVIGAPMLLHFFGGWYASEGTTTLRLLILSVLPNAVVSLAISRARAERRTGEVAWYLIATGLIVVGLTVVMVPRIGIAGAGLGWFVAETLLAGVVLLRDLRIVRRGSRSDTSVVLLDDRVLHTAATRSGRQALDREYGALVRLHADDRLGYWRRLLPVVLEAEGGRLATSRIAGRPGRRVSSAEYAAAVDAIRALHDLTSRNVVLRAADLDAIVDEPAAVLRGVLTTTTHRRIVDNLTIGLRAALDGQVLPVGWTHGDFHPGNVLYDVGRVSGIVDWEQASVAYPVALDTMFWALTTAGDRHQLGRRVVDRLRHGCSEPERRLLGATDVRLERALLLLTWLRHVAGNLTKSERYAANPIWLRRNVVPVLREVAR